MYRFEPAFVPFKTRFECASLGSVIQIVSNLPDVHYVGGVRSQLRPKSWLHILTAGSGYDPDIRYLLEGITFGFKVIDHDAMIDPYYCTNYSSCHVDCNRAKLESLLDSEVFSGKFSVVSEKPKCVHSLGVISKRDSTKIRPITDCSQPEGYSVNSFMESVQDKFHYVTVQEVVSHMLGGNLFVMSTVDLADAYRSVMVRPCDREYFGLSFNGKYLVDNCLCFGSRSAPFIFNRLTDAICRYMRDRGTLCFNYLDDIICLSKDMDAGYRDQLELISVLRFLGFYIAWKKICSPTKRCVYLGIEIDTDSMCLRLPEERLLKLRKELEFWVNRRKATEKQLQVLLGHLSHCARIIQGANLYMHFLFKKLSEARGKRKVKISRDFHEDLSWWYHLAFSFNSVPLVDVTVNRFWIQVASGTYPIVTPGSGFDTVIEWPCVCIASQAEDLVAIMNEVNDTCIGFGEGESQGLIDLFLPQVLVNDPVAGELAAIWAYLLFREGSLSNCCIDVFCVKKQTWLCLKKSRVKNDLLAMLLRHIFWWSMERNVKLLFWFYPLDY